MSKITEKELEILFPNRETNIQESTKVNIRPFNWKECFTVVDKFVPVLQQLFASGALSFDENGEIQFGSVPALVQELVAVQGPLNEIMEISTGLEKDVLDSLMLDDITRIITTIFEVNASFFDKSVLPIIVKMRSQVQAK